MRGVLRDAHIERPTIEDRKNFERMWVGGWTVAGDSRAMAVEIVYRNRIVGVAPVDRPRADVEAGHPDLPGAAYGFQQLIDVADLAHEFELNLRAVLEDGNRVPLGSLQARHGTPPESETGAGSESTDDESASSAQVWLEGEIDRLIADALEGREKAPAPDAGFLDRLELRGRRVLVIGSGLGDFARALRAHGAGLVDVLEPDPHLARLERLKTSHHDVTRVSFFEHDVAAPQSYAASYGAIFAPHGLDDLKAVLPQIAKTTHVLITSLPSKLPKPVTKLFPHNEEVGGGSNGRGQRTLVLASSPDALSEVVKVSAAGAR